MFRLSSFFMILTWNAILVSSAGRYVTLGEWLSATLGGVTGVIWNQLVTTLNLNNNPSHFFNTTCNWMNGTIPRDFSGTTSRGSNDTSSNTSSCSSTCLMLSQSIAICNTSELINITSSPEVLRNNCLRACEELEKLTTSHDRYLYSTSPKNNIVSTTTEISSIVTVISIQSTTGNATLSPSTVHFDPNASSTLHYVYNASSRQTSAGDTTGVIIGAVVGSVLGLLFIVALVLLVCYALKKRNSPKKSEVSTADAYQEFNANRESKLPPAFAFSNEEYSKASNVQNGSGGNKNKTTSGENVYDNSADESKQGSVQGNDDTILKNNSLYVSEERGVVSVRQGNDYTVVTPDHSLHGRGDGVSPHMDHDTTLVDNSLYSLRD